MPPPNPIVVVTALACAGCARALTAEPPDAPLGWCPSDGPVCAACAAAASASPDPRAPGAGRCPTCATALEPRPGHAVGARCACGAVLSLPRTPMPPARLGARPDLHRIVDTVKAARERCRCHGPWSTGALAVTAAALDLDRQEVHDAFDTYLEWLDGR